MKKNVRKKVAQGRKNPRGVGGYSEYYEKPKKCLFRHPLELRRNVEKVDRACNSYKKVYSLVFMTDLCNFKNLHQI